jgi:hypothetical protein
LFEAASKPYYYVDFTSKEAERRDLFHVFYTRRKGSGKEEPHTRLFEIQLNQQLGFHHYEDRPCSKCKENYM